MMNKIVGMMMVVILLTGLTVAVAPPPFDDARVERGYAPVAQELASCVNGFGAKEKANKQACKRTGTDTSGPFVVEWNPDRFRVADPDWDAPEQVNVFTVGSDGSVDYVVGAETKAELIEALASTAGLQREAASNLFHSFIESTANMVKKGDRVALVGFGSFSISKRDARKGRNPQTGKEIKIPAKNPVEGFPVQGGVIRVEGRELRGIEKHQIKRGMVIAHPAVITSTPDGDTVIRILQKKLPMQIGGDADCDDGDACPMPGSTW